MAGGCATGSVDLGMFVRGILGHEQNSMSHLNYLSHQIVGSVTLCHALQNQTL